MPSKHPITTASKKKKKGPSVPYSVYHVKAGGDDVLVEVVSAPNATLARQYARKRLSRSTILHIRKGAGQDDFPGARFIRGKFRLAEFSDDSMLMEINK